MNPAIVSCTVQLSIQRSCRQARHEHHHSGTSTMKTKQIPIGKEGRTIVDNSNKNKMRHRPLVDGVQREERREPPASQIASILNEDEIAAAWRRRRTRRRQGSTLELLQEIKKKNIFRICQQTIPEGELHSLVQRRFHFQLKATVAEEEANDPNGPISTKGRGGKKASRREIVSVT